MVNAGLKTGGPDFREAFAGRRVLVTGNTGFKGAWLTVWLKQLDAEVIGYALAPPTSPALFTAAQVERCVIAQHTADIRDRAAFARVVAETKPDVIFHLAAQAIVLTSYQVPAETFDVNVMGTVSVLEAVRTLASPCAVVVVTSDKCYANREQVWGYREIDAMGGHDPYSASKGAAELVVAAYRQSYFSPERLPDHRVQLASVRTGNVIGGGDWAAARIVADLARFLAAGEPIPIRSPRAVRPWQHVLEPLSGYLMLAAKMVQNPSPQWCGAWNFGPLPDGAVTVREIAEIFIESWGQGTWIDRSEGNKPHEAHFLRLSIEKALTDLAWRPRWSVREAVRRTAQWYKRYYADPTSATAACLDDIGAFHDTSAVHDAV
jgi:CDP-glucose 4,6-dehydratase